MMKVIAFKFSRLYKMIEDDMTFGIISACRHEHDGYETLQQANNRRTAELERDLRQLGYGFVKIKGGYIEKDENGNDVEVVEDSFLVRGLTKKQLIKLAQKYNQDSFLWKEKGFIGYIDKYGNIDMEFKGGISTQEEAVKQYFSELKRGKRKFAFLSEMIPNSFTRAVKGQLNEYRKYIF